MIQQQAYYCKVEAEHFRMGRTAFLRKAAGMVADREAVEVVPLHRAVDKEDMGHRTGEELVWLPDFVNPDIVHKVFPAWGGYCYFHWPLFQPSPRAASCRSGNIFPHYHHLGYRILDNR